MGVAFHTMVPVFKKLFKPKNIGRGAPKTPGIKVIKDNIQRITANGAAFSWYLKIFILKLHFKSVYSLTWFLWQ